MFPEILGGQICFCIYRNELFDFDLQMISTRENSTGQIAQLKLLRY
jgi:hypothetical protein